MISLSDGFESFLEVVGVTIEAEAVFAEEFGVDFCGRKVVFLEKLGANGVETVKIKSIIFYGFF